MHKAKKSLGQNFLKSQKALSDIVSAALIQKNDVVLEIGPGKGALTEKLLERAGKVIAIEKDRELVTYLQEKFGGEIKSKKLELIEADILDPAVPWSVIRDRSYKLVANIPYYITGAIIRKFLTAKVQPERMVLLVQKEVAKRIVASDGKESLLSISVKAFATPKYIGKVDKRYFSPAPKVDSAIILIGDISHENFKNISEEFFFEVLRAGFTHKRKVLASNLKEFFTIKETLEKTFSKIGLPLKIRAEELKIEKWLKLVDEIQGKAL